MPRFFRVSCCTSNLSISGWFQELKKKRVSHFLCRSIMASRHGEHAAEPTKATTRSNSSYNWYTRCITAVLFPHLRAPTAASTRGIRSITRLGSHVMNILIVTLFF